MIGLLFPVLWIIIVVAVMISASKKSNIGDTIANLFGPSDETNDSRQVNNSPARQFFNEAKAAGKQEFSHRTSELSRKVSFNVETDYNDQKPYSKYAEEIRKRGAKYRAASAGYDRMSLDYCDSSISKSKGISFRNKPAGMDELAYLAKYNNARENEIIKQMKHSHFDE